ncbi:MAG TPA: CHASE2 domain-containing protein, partial [Candidatus Wallbacteria bacterium]|nr:CHASE2 domain-containing protein [Candidatus Wallbacteria bacterium]
MMFAKLKGLFSKKAKRSLATLSICVMIFVLTAWLDTKGEFTWGERKFNDIMLKSRPRADMPILDNIVLVGMDDESVEKIGRWPWNRSVFAEFLRFVKRGNPRAVLFDIEFLEKFTRNSKAEKYQLFDQLEIWYEGLPKELKANFKSDSDENILKLIQDYGNYFKEPRPFADTQVTDDDYLADSLKIIGKAYLAMHFSDELLYYVNILKTTLDNADILKKLPAESRDQVNKDYLIYRKLENKFDCTPEEISEATKVKIEYVKTRIFDIRNFRIQNLADKIILDQMSSGSKEIDFNSVRTSIFGEIKITSEIDLVRKNILVGIEDIIMSRIELFENVKLISSRGDSVDLPENVKKLFWNEQTPSAPVIPVQKLLKNAFSIGSANNSPDEDGVYRRHPLFFELGGKFVPQISIRVAKELMGLDFANSYYIDRELHVPIKDKSFSEKLGPVLKIPVNEDGTVLFNWAARYDDPHAFKNAPFYSHFYNLMEIEKGVYSFMARVLCEGLDGSSIAFFKTYNEIRENGLSRETIDKLTPIIPKAFENVNDIGDKLVSAFARPDLKYEQLKRLKKRANDIYMTKYQLTSFQNNIIGPDNYIDGLKDKILIIGLSAHATSDVKPTPVSAETPMFFGHANILNAMFQNKFIRYASAVSDNCLIAIMSIFSFTILTFLHPGSAFVMTLLAIAGYAYFAFFMFCKTGVFLKIINIIAIMLANFTVVTLYFYFSEEREKQFVRQAFSHYLSPNAMEDILDDPSKLKLQGERRFLTVLFSDVRSFTTFSENHTPEEVVTKLNEYLDYMTDIVFKYKGTL